MKKILVVSYLFAPISVIGAIRWSKMAKYLTRMGYEVDVITTSAKAPEDKMLVRDLQSIPNVIRIDHRKHKYDETVYFKDLQTAAAIKKAAEKGRKPLSRRIKDAIWHCAPLKKITSIYVAGQDYGRSKDFFNQAKKYIKKNLDMSSYSAAICSYGPTSGTMLALWLKKTYPDLPLIMDFRDPMITRVTPPAYKRIYTRLQNNICERADRLVCVADGYYDHICGDKYSEKRYTLSNGYDPEDYTEAVLFDEPRYSFAYTVGSGGMYGGRADFRPFYSVLAELIDEGKIDKKDVVFHHIGNDGELMREQAADFGLGDIVENHGRVPREQALGWQRSVRHLSLAIWNHRDDSGVFPGKLLEYMNAGCPMIGIVNGEIGGSNLRTIAEKGRFGIVYESVSHKADRRTLKEYLASDYARWKQGLAPDFQPDEDYIKSFSYPARARAMAEIIEAAGR